jgi:erythronate-4-phosphate dehydrogenase
MSEKRKIVIDDAIPFAKSMFSPLGEVVLMPGRAIDAACVADADALIVRSRTQVNAKLLENSTVSFVGSSVVGLDHIDQAWLKARRIAFYSAQGCNANSVAEFVITALLELAEDKDFDLSQKTLGIVGVGQVGRRVCEKATALGMTCLVNDPPKVKQHPELAPHFVALDTCLQADIITFHTPLTLEGEFATHHLLSAERLAQIRPDQVIVNAARGGIIDEDAWSQTPTLANLIDCWENEPFIHKALYKTAYLATPHIAGHSLDAKIAGGEMVYHALCQHWRVTPKTHWQTLLPADPEPITLAKQGRLQSKLFDALKTTHNPRNDDLAIRRDDLQQLYQEYELYRRNYPVHREWPAHRFMASDDDALNNLLISLGFKRTS